MARVLVISDLHAPFTRKGYLEFIKKVYREYRCNKVVFIGDIIDSHTISRHNKSPEAEGVLDEMEKARILLKGYGDAFPNASVCFGNHDLRPYFQASTVGIPSKHMKKLEDVYGTPKGWKWDDKFNIDNVIYLHGYGSGDNAPHLRIAKEMRSSIVCGHFHSVGGVGYSATQKDIVFGMCVGCAINEKLYAFDYARNMIKKPIIACGVVIDGVLPILIPMPLKKEE